MGCSGGIFASGLRGIAWLLVEAYGARVSGGRVLADPGGQRVLMLGGMEVVARGGVVGDGAATAAAPITNPDKVA